MDYKAGCSLPTVAKIDYKLSEVRSQIKPSSLEECEEGRVKEKDKGYRRNIPGLRR